MEEQETVEQQDFSEGRPFDGEVYGQSFRRCDFTSADLSGVSFVDCAFEGCNLSMARFDDARLQGVLFSGSKLLGVDFSSCSDFALAVGFEGCNLNFASFWGKKLEKTRFAECSLQEANFTEANLTASVFSDCDLTQARFERTVLESADLRTARNFSIDPDLNRIRRAKFARLGLEGLLHKYGLEIE